MARCRYCGLIPKWFSKKTGFKGPKSGPFLPGGEWLKEWADQLNEAERPPTLAELEFLINACFIAGHAECANDIAAAVLSNPEAFEVEIDLLTRTSLQLICARSSASLNDTQTAKDLITTMASPNELTAALEHLGELSRFDGQMPEVRFDQAMSDQE